MLKSVLLLAALACGEGALSTLGPDGLSSSILPGPSGFDTVTLQDSSLCQKVAIPAGGFVVNNLGAWAAASDLGVGLPYTLSLHNAKSRLAMNASNWTSGANVLRLPGQILLKEGDAYVCITAPSNVGPISIATDATNVNLLVFDGPLVPQNVTRQNSTLEVVPGLSLYLIGQGATMSVLPYLETFDTWDLCDPLGCSVVSGPCMLPAGWSNPPDDDFDWSVNTGPTDTRQQRGPTGPAADYTTNSTGNYIYSEASPPCGVDGGIQGHVAHLVSPILAVTRGWFVQVDYWMHMYGHGDTEFHIDASADAGDTWTKDVAPMIKGNKGDAWRNYTADLSDFVYTHVRDQGLVVRFRTVSGNVTEVSFEGDVALDNIMFSVDTRTPTSTMTPSSSPSNTETLTFVPTRTTTATAVPTKTPTMSQTETPMRAYVPIGIPDPPQVLGPAWASVLPTAIVVGELSSLQLTGLWLYGVNRKADIKFAVWSRNCLDRAVGTEVVALDEFNVGHINAPTVVGRYMLCIRHRQDWEEVGVVDVLPPDAARVYFGYSSCEQLLRFNQSVCGCWYRKGDLSEPNPATFTLPLGVPAWQFPPGPQTVVFEQGCCQRGTKERQQYIHSEANLPDTTWGICKDHDARGQLGAYGCPVVPENAPAPIP